jgi:iron uptake system component EfeO
VRRWRAALGAAAVIAAIGAPVFVACSDSPSSPRKPEGVTVKASDTACLVATTTFGSGNQSFVVSNAGSQVTEVVVYGPGDRVVGEVSNIGPSTGKKLTVALKPGRYEITCKPGLVGKGIRTPITVKASSGALPTTSPALDAAVAGYRRYAVAQAGKLLAQTRPFVAAVQAGDIAKAMALYAPARLPYETIEPIAESSGDLDARIDARIDDVENGQEWLGFHRLEHDLWKTGDISLDGPVATALLADVTSLVDQVQRVELSADQVSAAAVTLLDDVAPRGLAGEEERYSRMDLVDVAANVQGAQMAYQSLRALVLDKDPDLVTKIDTRFMAAVQALAAYGGGASFEDYDALSKSQVRTLTSDVNALVSPMSNVTKTLQKSDKPPD